MGVCQRGMGKEESGGLGEKTRKGKGDCSRAAPLSPGCLPKTPVNLYCVSVARRASEHAQKKKVTKSQMSKRDPNTQSIKNKLKANGHKKEKQQTITDSLCRLHAPPINI